MALANLYVGRTRERLTLLDFLKKARLPSGAMLAANKNGLTTGFNLDAVGKEKPKPWLYFDRPHVGATAWLVLAESGMNPFWPEEKP